MTHQPKWLDIAWGEKGVREIRGPRDNPKVVGYFRDAGHAYVDNDEWAWCAAFVGACLKRAGLKPSGSLMARSYLKWGRALRSPRVGAICVLSRGSNPAHGHVGFYLYASDDKVYLLGGNQSNAVKVSGYARSRVLGYRWPSAEAKPRASGQVATRVGRARPDGAKRRDAKADRAFFDVAMVHLLRMEGGFTEDPYDKGGPTNYGITIHDLARHRKMKLNDETFEALREGVRTISMATVRAIYWREYWLKASCPKLPEGVALMHFDAAVLQGVKPAARFLQRALGNVDVDGEIGPRTLRAVAAADQRGVIERYGDVRRAKLRTLKHFWRFGKGWMWRMDETVKRALKAVDAHPVVRASKGEAGNAQASKTEAAKGQNGTGNDKRAAGRSATAPHHSSSRKQETQTMSKSKPQTKWWGESMTIWGATLTAVTTVLPLIGPLFGLNITEALIQQLGQQIVQLVQIAGGVIGTLVTIYGRTRATAQLYRRPIKLMV
ncbi:MAG: TIGR02594 family protein [Pseudomonadota bacterium]